MNTLLNTISHLRWALFKPTVWPLVILNKPVFDNTCLQVPATDSASPVVRVSVPLSSLLLLLYCYICSLTNCCCTSAGDSIVVHIPFVYITYTTVHNMHYFAIYLQQSKTVVHVLVKLISHNSSEEEIQ